MITMKRASLEDIPSIMRFIDEQWKENHILARDRDFFEWQFVDGNQVNVFLAVDDSGKIYGMLGAILYSHSAHPDISGSIWKTIKSENPMLGIELGDFVYAQLGARYACSPGMNKRACKIYQLQGMDVVSMEHYYRLNNKNRYVIARITQKTIPAAKDTQFRLELIHSVEDMKQIIPEQTLLDGIMSKDYAYIEKRYFQHPIYRYDIWKIIDSAGESHAVLITREEQVQDSKCCKIVDFYGRETDMGQITAALDSMMKERDYEFIDIYSYGVPAKLYEKAGFVRCEENSENIIPNYFHPFEQKNISLNLIDPHAEGLKIFRGDGDQDRPS